MSQILNQSLVNSIYLKIDKKNSTINSIQWRKDSETKVLQLRKPVTGIIMSTMKHFSTKDNLFKCYA